METPLTTPDARRLLAALALAAALVAGLVAGPAASPATAATTKQATVNLNLRTGASTSYRVVTTLQKGTKVSVSSTKGSWSRVAAGKKSGWVSSKYLATPAAAKKPAVKKPAVKKPAVKKPAAKKPTAKMTTANLNLRSGASSTYRVVKVLKKGTRVSVSSTKGSWSQVAASGKTGWVSSKYLKNAPTAAAKPKPVAKPKPQPVVKPKPVTKPAPAPKPAPKPSAGNFATTVNLNLRKSAPSGAVLATIPSGDTVTKNGSTAQSGSWVQVKYGTTTGWVSASYLKAAATPSTTRVPASFAVSGAGWGHGVGMSQYGAQGQAMAGRSAALILNHYYAPATMAYTSSQAAADIRVQILAASTSSVDAANGSLRLMDGTKVLATTTGKVSLAVKSGKVAAKAGSKTYTPRGKLTVVWENTRFWAGKSKGTTVAVPKANDGSGTVNYRHGKLEVGVLNEKLNLVNVVRLNDEYLYGLAEMPSSWQPAALQAQAVAGRTYAMRNMSSVKKGCDCNVYDEVASQKFTAWNKENEGVNAYYGKRWKAAVDATTGRTSAGTPTSGAVLLYSGSLIDAVYSSSTGGRTRSSATVWGSQHAYLQSRDDHWSLLASSGNPNRSWTSTATQAQVAKAFGTSNVTAVKVARNSDLTIKSATATTSTGAVRTISGSAFRAGIATKSSWVTGVAGR